MFSLPVLVVLIVGLVIAIRRRREYPKVATLVIISCALSILTYMLVPAIFHVLILTQAIRFTVVAAAWSLTGTCLAAVSAGLLIYAAFLGRDTTSGDDA